MIINPRDDELSLTVKFSRRQITEILEFLGTAFANLRVPSAHSQPPNPDRENASRNHDGPLAN